MTKYIFAFVAMLCVFFFAASVANADVYPTSKDAPKSTWNSCGNNPYNGMPYEGCIKLGYTPEQCAEYKRLRSVGAQSDMCRYMDIPDGTVLDKQLYGGGIILEDVLVDLETFSTRRSLVCEVGGDALISHDCCNNLSVVKNWRFAKAPEAPAKQFTARPYVKPTQPCPLENVRYQLVSVLESAARQHECAQRLVAVEAENGLDGERLSRECGPMLNKEYNPGELNHAFELVWVPEGFEIEDLLFQGAVQHNRLTASEGYEHMLFDGMIRIPDTILVNGETIPVEGGKMQLRFGDYGKLYSPQPTEFEEWTANVKRAHDPAWKNGCGVWVATAIERLEPVPAPANAVAMTAE